jgi:hypothetical protein
MNPIEHLWADMKKELSKLGIKNKKDLKEGIIKIWNSIPSSFTQKLINSILREWNWFLRQKEATLNTKINFVLTFCPTHFLKLLNTHVNI